jgi:FHA domain
LEPPYVSLLIATKHKHLFKTRFQLSFSTILIPDGKKSSRPIILGKSYRSDMVLNDMSISARHASIRYKNGDFYFLDECSSNGSYLYLRRPVELHPFIPVQFRLRKSILSLKVVDKWNRRFKGGRRTKKASDCEVESSAKDDHSIGSNDDNIRISDESGTRNLPRRTRESIMQSLPPKGQLNQNSRQHLDLLYALAYPDREKEIIAKVQRQENTIEELEGEDSKVDEFDVVVTSIVHDDVI